MYSAVAFSHDEVNVYIATIGTTDGYYITVDVKGCPDPALRICAVKMGQ